MKQSNSTAPAQAARPGIGARSADAAADLTMALLALLITAVSGYTTYKGMIRIVGADAPAQGVESWFPTVVAVSITAVVQIGLTVLCWVMGRDFARAITRKMHERRGRTTATASIGKVISMLALLSICFAVSVFYSFNTYFNSMYEGKEERRVEARAVPAVSLEVSTLLDDAVAEHRAGRVDAIRAMAQDGGYFAELKQIEQTVADAGGRFELRFAEIKAQEIEAEKQRIAAEFDNRALLERKQSEIGEAKARIEEATAGIDALEAAVSDRSSRIAELRIEEKNQLDEAQKQLSGEGDRPSGAGRIYANAMAAAKRAADEIATLEAAIATNRGEIETLKSEQFELEKTIGIMEVEIGSAGGTLEQPSGPGALPVSSVEEIAAAVQATEKARIAFEQNPVRPAYDGLQAACASLVAIGLADAEAKPLLETTSCKARSDRFDAAVDSFTAEDAQRGQYRQACSGLGSGGVKPAKAVETLRQCHFLALAAGVSADDAKAVRAFDAVEEFAAKFDKDQHPFLKTLRAFSIAPNLAALALFFAAIQDVAVFIMTFMVEFFRREREFARQEQRDSQLGAEEIEAIRYMLAKADPVPGRKDAYSFRLTPERVSAMSTDEVLAIKSVIEDLRSRGMITALNRSTYVIANTGFVTLNNRLRNAPQQRGAGSGTVAAKAAQPPVVSAEGSENVLALAARLKSS